MTKRDPEVVKAAVASQRGMVERFFARLAEGNCAKPGITRDTYGEGENWGHRVLLEHGGRAGLAACSDAAADTYVPLPAPDRAAPRILMGSPLARVPHRRTFDAPAAPLPPTLSLPRVSGSP